MRYLGQTVAILLLCLSMAAPARAVTLLRDADIEHALKQLARPILTAAGLPVSSIRVLVVKESDYNAFVVDSRHIFITSGLLMKLTSAARIGEPRWADSWPLKAGWAATMAPATSVST